MTGRSANATAVANVVGENSSSKRNDLRFLDDMLAVARRIWPAKTAANLAAAAGVSERAAQFWLAGETGMTLAAARELMRSEHGYEFLVAYVGADCGAAWFVRTQVAEQRASVKRSIRDARRRLDALDARQSQLDMFL